MRRFLQLLVLLLCFGSIGGRSEKAKPDKNAEEKDEIFNGEPPSTQHWIDPHNMADDSRIYPRPTSCVSNEEMNLAAAFKNIQEQLHNCEGQLQTYNKQGPPKETLNCGSPHLKQIIQALLKATSDINPHVDIRLTLKNRRLLQKFLEDQANIHDVIEIVKNSFTDKTLSETLHDNNYWLYVQENFDILTLSMLPVLLCIVISVVLFELKTRLTIHQQFFYLLIVAFIVSIPWEWFRLYKKEFARKQSLMMENIRKHCHTDQELSIAQSLRLWGKSLFSVEDSGCSKYQEALLIDPIWEVSPLRAVSVTIVKFIVEPFEPFADGAGKSFRTLFQHLPIQWQPLMFLACLIIIIICLILFSGIRINTPFFQVGLGVDPAITNVALQRLEHQMGDLIKQNAAVIQNGQPAAIQDIADNGRNQHIVLVQQLTAINERSQRHDNVLRDIKNFLPMLRPVAEQARRAEAIEHRDWELVDNGLPRLEEEITALRRPVQASEHYPTESNADTIN